MKRLKRRIRPEKTAQHVSHIVSFPVEFFVKQVMMKPCDINFAAEIAALMRRFKQRNRVDDECVMIPLAAFDLLMFMRQNVARLGGAFPH